MFVRARILKLLRTPGIDSSESIPCEKSIPLWNSYLETSIPCEGIEDFWIVVVMCCVWGKDTTIGQHISNTQLWAGDEKAISASKIYILWDMADLIPYLVPAKLARQAS